MRGHVQTVRVTTSTPLPPFDEVYRRCAQPVYRFCLSQVRDPTDAEDLAADTFAAAFTAYERTRPDADGVLPWLLRIARNGAVDHHRRQSRRSALLDRFRRTGGRDVAPTDVEREIVVRAELRELLARCQRLSVKDRTLIGLRVAADLTYQEIGAVMGMSEHAATVAAGRALGRLRDLYRERP